MKRHIRVSTMIVSYGIILLTVLGVAIVGSRIVTVMTENIPVEKRKCVIIDAGHGGVDGGTTSCTGILESAINLEIALRLNDLMNLLGIDTVMIRTTDESVYTTGESIAAKKVSDLKQRVKIVNETENAMLISLHQNHYPDSRYNGAQIFYAGTKNSDLLARKLQTALVQNLNPGSKRQAKKADGVYLMQNIDCTGILIECGFLSNPEEEKKLRSETYQKEICCVIAATVSLYLHDEAIA